MPASYVHQSIAAAAAKAHAFFASEDKRLISALLAGAEGPDPLFFSLFAPPRKKPAPALGAILHTQRTDEFLLALCEACADKAVTRAFCCGFMTHYAADTTFHPFVYAHSLTGDGAYSSTLHCTLEHQLETLHFRRQGNETSLPVQMGGYAALSREAKDQIAAAFHAAVVRVFPGDDIGYARIRRSFDDAVALCNLLRSEGGVKFRAMGALLSPFGLDAPLHAHMMPVQAPDTDIANDAHAPWASLWAPDVRRSESFDDLYAAAVQRAAQLIGLTLGMMDGQVSYATLRAQLGGLSYDSGLPWSGTCPASKAPGVKKKA